MKNVILKACTFRGHCWGLLLEKFLYIYTWVFKENELTKDQETWGDRTQARQREWPFPCEFWTFPFDIREWLVSAKNRLKENSTVPLVFNQMFRCAGRRGVGGHAWCWLRVPVSNLTHSTGVSLRGRNTGTRCAYHAL